MIWALSAALLFALVDLTWRSLLPGVSLWQALLWRSLSSSVLLVSGAILFDGAVLNEGVSWAEEGSRLVIPVLTGVAGLILFSWALRLASAQLVVPIINLTGLFVGWWEWGWLNRTNPTGFWGWMSIALATTGLLIWIVPSGMAKGTIRDNAKGVVLSLAAVLIWSRGYVDYPKAIEVVSPLWLAASVELVMLSAGVVLALTLKHSLTVELRSKAMWVGLGVALAVGTMTMAYSIMPASEVGLVSTLTPVLVVLLSQRWLGERIKIQDGLAISCLVLANALYFLSLIN